LILRMDNLLAGNPIPPFSGRFACRSVIQRRSPFRLLKLFRAQADHESAVRQSVIAFSPESPIAFIPER
jgi:hypothetical protein